VLLFPKRGKMKLFKHRAIFFKIVAFKTLQFSKQIKT